MKKNKYIALGLLLVLIFTSTGVFASSLKNIEVGFNEITLYVDGKKVDTDNILYKGTTYVPLRATADMLKKNVSFDASTKTANISDSGVKDSATAVKGTATKGKKKINVEFNAINIVVNEKSIAADNILYEGTTYAPIRAVAESMNKIVVWDQETFSAYIDDASSGGRIKVNGDKYEIEGDDGRVIVDPEKGIIVDDKDGTGVKINPDGKIEINLGDLGL